MPSVKSSKKRKEDRLREAEKCENLQRLSVILSVQQHDKTILKVLKQIEKLRPMEIVVIVNGSKDQSLSKLLSFTSYPLTAYVYPFALGEDIWRGIGAKEATGDVWLFLEADQVLAAKELQSFVRTCYRGADVALGKRMEKARRQAKEQDPVLLVKAFLNHLGERDELGTSSMSDLPFAITQNAASIIGVHHFVVPAVAHAIALQNRLRIVRSRVQLPSRIEKRENHRQTLLKDHLEALNYVDGLT